MVVECVSVKLQHLSFYKVWNAKYLSLKMHLKMCTLVDFSSMFTVSFSSFVHLFQLSHVLQIDLQLVKVMQAVCLTLYLLGC